MAFALRGATLSLARLKDFNVQCLTKMAGFFVRFMSNP